MSLRFESEAALTAGDRPLVNPQLRLLPVADVAPAPSANETVLDKIQREALAISEHIYNFGKAAITKPNSAEAGVALIAGTAIIGSILSYRQRLAGMAVKGVAGGLLPEASATIMPGLTTRRFMSEGVGREYAVYVPKSLVAGEKSPVLMALDGLTVRNPGGSMGTVNGLNALAEREGFIAVYPRPQSRLFGQISAWNPGLLNPKASSYSDSRYLLGVLDDLGKSGLPIDSRQVYGATFSEGAIALNRAAQSGRFAGVFNMSGTMLKSEMPAVGVKQNIIVRGELDPTLPAAGGAGPNSSILTRLGHTRILESEPASHAWRIAQANGFQGTATIVEHPYVRETVYSGAQTATGAQVKEYVIKAPYGGHSWAGRAAGDGTESAVSGRNGPLTPPAVFDANSKIAEMIRQGKLAIERDLGPLGRAAG